MHTAPDFGMDRPSDLTAKQTFQEMKALAAERGWGATENTQPLFFLSTVNG